MKYEKKDFFTEKEAKDVGGFIIIATRTDQYLIAEKWNRPEADGGPTWTTYNISEQALLDRVEAGKCEKTAEASDKQYQGILNLIGLEEDNKWGVAVA